VLIQMPGVGVKEIANGQRRKVPTIVWPDKGVEVGFHRT
jgi:hypothetical protein